MKKQMFILVIVLLFTTVLIPGNGNTADVRLWTSSGGMNLEEKGISEGHKSYHQFGFTVYDDCLSGTLSLGIDAFLRGEPADEDDELLQNGVNGTITYSQEVNQYFAPYLGLQFSYWSRDYNSKYPIEEQVDEFRMMLARGGTRINFLEKFLWIDLGTIIPFWVNTKSGNFGPDIGIGFNYRGFDLGYRYKQVILTDHHFASGNNDLKFYFSGIEMGYKF